MDAKELRIGNWYHWEAEGKKYEYQVKAKDFADDYIQNFYPIPLTEEWLERFGFQKAASGWYEKGCFAVHLDWFYGQKTRVVWEEQDVFNQIPHDITYVHQLQNLYFALTGEELEIKTRAI